MRAIQLEELIPQTASFKLAQTEKTYHLRRLNLEDEAWLQANFGDRLQEILSAMKMRDIARIAFHQLEESDKADFSPKMVKIYDEDGESKEVKLGGVNLFYALISGHNEKMAIYSALLETIGISRQMQDEIVEEVKKEQAQKKRELQDQMTGEKSSMSSQASTDGPSQKLENSL